MKAENTATPEDNPALSPGVLSKVMGYRLRRLHNLFSIRIIRWYQNIDLNITPVQALILQLIDENPGLMQVALARLLKVEAPTVYQALSPLVNAGFVERKRSQADGRAFALHLSAKGLEALVNVRAGVQENEEVLLANMSAEERQQLGALLDKAHASAEKVLKDEAL
jgi:DNA-binding MarR family transcriptional regulator